MADSPSSASPQTSPSSALQSAQNQLVQIVGKLVGNTSSQSGDLVAALNAVAAAINAKPSA